MFLRVTLFISVSVGLLLAGGCRDEKIATYRVPRETPLAKELVSAPAANTTPLTTDLTPDPTTIPVVWQAPATWVPKALGTMRKGSFLIRSDDGSEADVSIISFPGSAGGLVENLNRWRGQLKLPPLAAEQITSATTELSSGNLKFTVVDFLGEGPAGRTRILGAVLPFGDETYFFKLIGPDAFAEKSRPAFLDFLKTVKTR